MGRSGLETPDGGFVIGNPDAPLKLVEYASHTCSHCAEFSDEGSGPMHDEIRRLGRGQLRNPQPRSAIRST